jgi:hypothetical protein
MNWLNITERPVMNWLNITERPVMNCYIQGENKFNNTCI